jgi:hypothetical protein
MKREYSLYSFLHEYIMLNLDFILRNVVSRLKTPPTKPKQTNQSQRRKRRNEQRLKTLRTSQQICDEECKNLCYEATIACLQSLHDHVIEYLNKHIKELYTAHHVLIESRNDHEPRYQDRNRDSSRTCCYEDWIRECHPENVDDERCDREDDRDQAHDIDFRFYLQDSDHRIIWNSYVHSFGCPELQVDEMSMIMERKARFADVDITMQETSSNFDNPIPHILSN